MLDQAKKPLHRGTRELRFFAHDAEWQAKLTYGTHGELLALYIHPVVDENGCYPARLGGHYCTATSLTYMVNDLLVAHTALAIADTLRAIFTVANGQGAVVVRTEYAQFLSNIIMILRRGQK